MREVVVGGEDCHFHWVLNLFFLRKRLKRFGDEFFVFLDFVWVLGGAIGFFAISFMDELPIANADDVTWRLCLNKQGTTMAATA